MEGPPFSAVLSMENIFDPDVHNGASQKDMLFSNIKSKLEGTVRNQKLKQKIKENSFKMIKENYNTLNTERGLDSPKKLFTDKLLTPSPNSPNPHYI